MIQVDLQDSLIEFRCYIQDYKHKQIKYIYILYNRYIHIYTYILYIYIYIYIYIYPFVLFCFVNFLTV